MIRLASFERLRLRGGFLIAEIRVTDLPLKDALGREAIAQTHIVGRELRLLIRSGLSGEELSVTLYHEILEAVSIATLKPPESVMEFNEGHFERAAYALHERLGMASPETLNQMLQDYGFREE